jgi:hypothetical protein
MKKLQQLDRILFVVPMDSAVDVSILEAFIHEINRLNEHVKINVLYWNNNKNITKNKNYQRKANEWIDSDFSFFGKLINSDVEKYFNINNDLLVVFGENLPKKVNNALMSAKADLKMGFGKDVSYFDVLLSLESRDLSEQINMVKKYLV